MAIKIPDAAQSFLVWVSGVRMSNNEKNEKTLVCYKPSKSQEILETQLPNFS